MDAAEGQATISRLQIQRVFLPLAKSSSFGKLGVELLVVGREGHIFHPKKGLRILCKYQEDYRHHLAMGNKTLADYQHPEAADPGPVLRYLIALQSAQIAALHSSPALSII